MMVAMILYELMQKIICRRTRLMWRLVQVIRRNGGLGWNRFEQLRI